MLRIIGIHVPGIVDSSLEIRSRSSLEAKLRVFFDWVRVVIVKGALSMSF